MELERERKEEVEREEVAAREREREMEREERERIEWEMVERGRTGEGDRENDIRTRISQCDYLKVGCSQCPACLSHD